MSKVLIERESIEAIARKIKLKTADTTKMRVSDMPGRIGTLHGYRSSARVLSSDPVAFPLSTFALADAGTAIATAAKNTDFPHGNPQTVFDISPSLSFTTTAAQAE